MAALGLLDGFGTTLRMLFRRKQTVPYPETKRPLPERFRGIHALRRYDDGLERCVGCELCAIACPARAIHVESMENMATDPHSHAERYAWRYEIDLLRCIFCGFCEEACPTGAIHLTPDNELVGQERRAFIFTKEQFLERHDNQVAAAAREGGA